MIMKYIRIVLFCLMLVSCNNRVDDELLTIAVNVEKDDFPLIKEKIVIDEIIQLDDSIPIGNIRKVIFHKFDFFVLNKSQDEILCFQKDGKLKFRIFSKGRGPKEYVSIQNFLIDKYTDELLILSSDNKVLRYSCSSGDFLDVITQEGSSLVLDGIRLSKEMFAWYHMGPDFNLQIQRNGQTKSYIPFVEVRDMVFAEKAFTGNKDYSLFVHGTSNYVYKIYEDTLTPQYYVDFGVYKVPEQLYESPQQAIGIFEKQDVATKLDYISVNNNFFGFSYLFFPQSSFNIQSRYVIYCKESKTSYNIHSNYLFPVYDIVNDKFLSIVTPSNVLTSDKLIIDRQILDYIEINKIPEDANPLIVFWSIKN
ncbi:hypothetical protein SDC9_43232 [bioreactor metagenome]|uniref:6-bladed beta-propeller n=1 Tax=bioreactor metagenome TaxID=1076179 RepID=A0A644VZW6_9ZZZZ